MKASVRLPVGLSSIPNVICKSNGGSGQITVNGGDKLAVLPPVDGWDNKRERDTPHGKLEMIEWDSKTAVPNGG
jgi:hypothetical protein